MGKIYHWISHKSWAQFSFFFSLFSSKKRSRSHVLKIITVTIFSWQVWFAWWLWNLQNRLTSTKMLHHWLPGLLLRAATSAVLICNKKQRRSTVPSVWALIQRSLQSLDCLFLEVKMKHSSKNLCRYNCSTLRVLAKTAEGWYTNNIEEYNTWHQSKGLRNLLCQ